MILKTHESRPEAGKTAAAHAAESLRRAIRETGEARIIGASAASQIEFLASLVEQPGIDWTKVELFQLDEYIGLPADHPATFQSFLTERLISKAGIKHVHLLSGTGEPASIINRASQEIRSAPVDIAFVGIGENGHLAFNDPPANFETEEPYIVVNLDEACRQQQVGEGWFPTLGDVPTRAISMSVRQILKAKQIIAIVPGPQKAQAVQACFEEEISALRPASILRTHASTTVYLDTDSAARLQPKTLMKYS